MSKTSTQKEIRQIEKELNNLIIEQQVLQTKLAQTTNKITVIFSKLQTCVMSANVAELVAGLKGKGLSQTARALLAKNN